MSNAKARKVGLRTIVKSLCGRRYRSEVKRAWEYSEDEFWDHQRAAFLRMYAFARSRVPYYAQRPGAYPPLADDDRSVLELLAMLPVIGKKEVRAHNDALMAAPALPLTSVHRTSGTSGTPLKMPATLWERAYSEEIQHQWLERLFGTRYPRTLVLSGFMTPGSGSADLYWFDTLTQTAYLSIYHLAERHRADVLRLLRDLRPVRVVGYPSAVHQLAVLVGDGVRSTVGYRTAVVTSEVLLPEWREDITRSLCGRVIDFYGSQEGSHLAFECDEGRMHLHPSVGVVEVAAADGTPTAAGELGRVLVTGLVRRSMPLIRYELGDSVESTGYATGCACGLDWPTIGKVHGRSEDLIRTRDGRAVGLLGFHAFRDQENVREGQLVQLDYESFLCKVVLADGSTGPDPGVERHVREQVANRLQLKVDVAFEYLEAVPRGANGKFKAVEVRMPQRQAVGRAQSNLASVGV